MSPAKDHPASDTLSPCTCPPALPCLGELVHRGDGLHLASSHFCVSLPNTSGTRELPSLGVQR